MIRKRYRNILYLVFIVLVIFISSITLVYASLSSVLKISGQAQVNAASWDIHFDNIKISNGSVAPSKKPVLTTPINCEFGVKLNKPGDFFEFLIDVVNKGTIDAMIESIEKTPSLDAKTSKFLKYDISYSDGSVLSTKHMLLANKKKTLKVRVEFKRDVLESDLPTTTLSLNLGFILKYVQSDGSGTVPSGGAGDVIETKTVRMVSGDYNNPKEGDVFCIKSECFNVLSSDANSITGLSFYNLNVGGDVDTNGNYHPYSKVTYLQDETMKAFVKTGKPFHGVSQYANDTQHGSTQSAYLNSILRNTEYKYKDILQSFNVKIENVRALNINELTHFGCSTETFHCSNAPKWLFNSSFWTCHTMNDYSVYGITTHEYLLAQNAKALNFGIRPVVIVKKDIFK